MPKDSNTEAIILLCSLQNFENNATWQTFRKKQKKDKKQNKIKQNQYKKSDTSILCLDYVTQASFIVLKEAERQNFPQTTMMPHTADPLIKSLQMSIELLGSLTHTVLPYIPPRLGGRKAVKWGSLVVHHTAITLSCFYPYSPTCLGQ